MSATTTTATNLADRSQSLPVVECKFCGAEIAWVESKRTGKRYPAIVVRTPSESATRMYNLRVAPWQPHTREICEAAQQSRADGIREIEAAAGKGTTHCDHANCIELATHRTQLNEAIVESHPVYCDEHTEQIRQIIAKEKAHGMDPTWADPEPLS